MGKGRKTRSRDTAYIQYSRNLPADKLGAVVFGCKNHTIDECLEKGIFGLPASHYTYVQNITPGLPLFLFNYSDRWLHGIFEAASSGQLNIDRHAWIVNEGVPFTAYPAQVRIRVQRKCQPLHEEEFKHIISKNYYKGKEFWFELDKEQSKKLVKLFLSSQLAEETPCPQHVASNVTGTADEEFKNLDSKEYCGTTEMLQENSHPLPFNGDASAPKVWVELFKPPSDAVILNPSVPEWPLGACVDSTNIEGDSNVVECWEDHASVDNYQNKNYENEVACPQYHDKESGAPDCTDMLSLENRISLDEVVGRSEPLDSDYVLAKESAEVSISLAPQENCERDHNQPNLTDGAIQKDDAASDSYDSHYVTPELLQEAGLKRENLQQRQEIEKLKMEQLQQRQTIVNLEHDLADSKIEIDQLKTRFQNLEFMPSTSRDYCKTEYSSFSNYTKKESVLIVGGFDGCSWLSDLCLYYPSHNRVIQRCPMTSIRPYASVVQLNGQLYIFGGALNKECFDKVESYNPVHNQWFQRPSLNKRTQSLSGASINGKIFAIGGGDGVHCYSDVELYDPEIGSWIFSQPMFEKRFGPAAADMNGAIYVSGGYDGSNYLRTVERFDPREPSWTRLYSMNIKRSSHSLVAYEEKIYAIGGYNGGEMVSSVEVLDTRFGWWRMGEPMANPRGFFGSFVLGGKIYVLGGIVKGKLLDECESYTENSGWQMETNALGKRAYFGALVM